MNSFLPKTFTKFLFIAMLFVGQIAIGQTVVTHTFAGTSGTIDSNISYTTDRNTSANPPAFNTELRLYYANASPYHGCSITLSPASGVTITSVELYGLSSYTPTLRYTIGAAAITTSNPTMTLSGTTYSVSGLSVLNTTLKIRNANTSNTQGRLTGIKVTYTPAGPSIPTVTTTTVSSIATTTASSGGNVTADGGASVTAKGVYFGTTAVPTTGTSDGTGTGTYTSSLTSLSLNTQYFYRAFATNSVGTAYGSESNFYTLAATPGVLVVSNPQLTTLDVTVNATTQNSNPTATQYAIQTGAQYVQANGSLGATAVWQTAATWATTIVTGLANSTAYTFQTKARNGANVETSFGATASGTTLTPATVDWCNLQWPTSQTIDEGNTFTVYAKVYEGGITDSPGEGTAIDAWIGYSATNGTPDGTWTWVAASYFGDDGTNNDEYSTLLGAGITPGTYYYVSRFSISGGPYVYGGKNNAIWASTADSAVLIVNSNLVDFANIQYPLSGTITEGMSFDVYAQVYEAGITNGGGQGLGITAEIGYSTSNTTPDGTWTWLSTTYNSDAGNNDEYLATLAGLTAGTYYYASRFIKTGSSEYVYGGTNGSPWTTSGVLTVNALGTPVATAATVVGSTTFTANWDAVTDATSYEIDVYESTSSVATDLFISEYVEGSSNNKAIELYNGTGASLNLSNYTLVQFNNGATRTTGTRYALPLSGTLTSGSTYVIVNNSANTTLKGFADLLSTSALLGFNGDDAFAIYLTSDVSGTTIDNGAVEIDIFGEIGVDPGAFWSVGGNTTQDESLVRNSNVLGGITTNQTGFPTLGTDWTSSAVDTFTNLGSHTFSGGTSTTYFLQNENVGSVTSYEVTGLNPETTYFYVVRAILGANTSANSNEIEVTTTAALVSVTWDGFAWSNVDGPDASLEAVLEGAYATSTEGGFTAKKLTVSTGGSLTIGADTSVTVVNELVNELSESEVVIENDGSLIQNGTSNNNTGNVTVKRNTQNLMRLDYTLWSSPVDVQNLGDFSPQTVANRFYTYATATNTYAAIANTNDFTVGQGYLIRTPNNHPTSPTAWEGNFIGKPNSGDITFGLSTAGTGFNLVGNPYPSPISITTFLSENSGVITGNLYFWRKTNAAAGSAYVTYSGGTFSDGAHAFDNIQPGQGFIVEATAANDLSFANTQRAAGNGVFYRNGNTTQSEDNSRIWLNLTSNNTVVGQMAVGYRADASNDIDAFDANYFNDSSVTTVALNSIVANTQLAVQHRASFEPTDVVALSFKTNTAGNYTIAINAVDGLFDDASQTIFLKDNLLNTEHDLRNAPYTFTSEVGTFNSRFEIVYQSTLSVLNPTLENDVVVYTQNNSIEIKTATEQIASVKVFDLKGSLIANVSNVNTTSVSIPLSNVANQVLVVQVTTQNGLTVARKVVR